MSTNELEELRAENDALRDALRRAEGREMDAMADTVKTLARFKALEADNAALLEVARAVEGITADVAEEGNCSDCPYTTQEEAARLLAVIRSEHPGKELLDEVANVRARVKRLEHDEDTLIDMGWRSAARALMVDYHRQADALSKAAEATALDWLRSERFVRAGNLRNDAEHVRNFLLPDAPHPRAGHEPTDRDAHVRRAAEAMREACAVAADGWDRGIDRPGKARSLPERIRAMDVGTVLAGMNKGES